MDGSVFLGSGGFIAFYVDMLRVEKPVFFWEWHLVKGILPKLELPGGESLGL